MWVHRAIARGVMFALAAAACWWMTPKFGPWIALAIWAVAMGIICGAIGVLMNMQTPGKVSFLNYVMGYVLPWGYKIGRGKLLPIVITSWIIWVLLGAVLVIAMHPASQQATVETEPIQRSKTVMTLLVIAWLIDGAVLLRLIGIVATSANRGHMVRSVLGVTLALVGMIGGSVALVMLSQSASSARWALLLAGGPTLLVGGGYGLFMIVILISGRKGGWH